MTTIPDKTLLELAAKAEGHGVEFDEASGLFWYDNIYTGLLWNPLHNDGDALRLAVKLGLTVCVSFKYGLTWADKDDKGHDHGHCAHHDGGPSAATRRAIVRAAAMVGESM